LKVVSDIYAKESGFGPFSENRNLPAAATKTPSPLFVSELGGLMHCPARAPLPPVPASFGTGKRLVRGSHGVHAVQLQEDHTRKSSRDSRWVDARAVSRNAAAAAARN